MECAGKNWFNLHQLAANSPETHSEKVLFPIQRHVCMECHVWCDLQQQSPLSVPQAQDPRLGGFKTPQKISGMRLTIIPWVGNTSGTLTPNLLRQLESILRSRLGHPTPEGLEPRSSEPASSNTCLHLPVNSSLPPSITHQTNWFKAIVTCCSQPIL